MIPTVPFDLIFSILVGLVFSACARQQFMNGAAPWGRELIAILSFEAIVFWPVETYFYLVYPDWSWMYFVDPKRLPFGVSVLVMLGYAATLFGGYLAGWALLRARRPQLVYGLVGAVALALVVFAVACRARMGQSGSYAEFHAGLRPLPLGKLGWALGVTTLGTLSAVALVGLTLREQGRRFRSE